MNFKEWKILHKQTISYNGKNCATPLVVVQKIIDSLDIDWFNPDLIFCDPCAGFGTFLVLLREKLKQHGHSEEHINKNMLYGYDINSMLVEDLLNNQLGFGNVCEGNYINIDTNMKFDVTLLNPPYQDNSNDGGQNKIYNMFAKKAISDTKDDGIVAVIAPTSVTKKSKRFSLINQYGLKKVDFTANNYFDVGVNICYFIIDKKYKGLVDVKTNTGIYQQPNNEVIIDTSKHNNEFIKLYSVLKSILNKPQKRMFLQNIAAAKWGDGRNKTQTNQFLYPIHKIDKKNGKILIQYNKNIPYHHNKKKLIIPLTKSFKPGCEIIDTDDYDVNYVSVEYSNKKQIDNIKSFIYSDYFINHVEQWKKYEGYGFNEAIKFVPPFDINKKWNNDLVKEFLESFIKN